MKSKLLILAGLLLGAGAAFAQVPVTGKSDVAGQQALLRNADPKLAANKKLVFDFFREVLDARHVELAEKYMAESYIQHNPSIPTGRAAFQKVFSRMQPQEIKPTTKWPLVAVMAEGDLVTLIFVVEHPEPNDSTKKYTTTWFDTFRVENGKVAEHWDAGVKGQGGPPPAQ